MRKRLIEIRKNKKGYTMTELLMVIGIIAVVCAIAIPSIVMISRSLRFKQRNDYAKSVFMAAQQNLTEMRSDGELDVLQSVARPEERAIPAGGGFPDEFRTEYVYTYTDEDAFNLVLPVGSVDSSVRDANIIIEYNPLTGNVYSVFYSEERGGILDGYRSGSLPRDKDENDRKARKDLMLGYYDGSGLNSSHIEIERTQAIVQFDNGQEGMVSVLVPMPELYFGDVGKFTEALEIQLTISCEQSLAEANPGPAADPLGATEPIGPAAAKSFTVNIKSGGQGLNGQNIRAGEDGKTIIVEFPIDSLAAKQSFANHASNTAGAASLTSLTEEDEFVILPGENVTIQADVKFESSSGIVVKVDPGILSGVNPMFEYLQPSGNGGYILAVSNGRNLQNLNALAPSVAEKVESVVFTADIDWNETVSYYTTKYGASSIASDEAPARALPYFVPIHHEGLFGTAKFIFPGEGDGGVKDFWQALGDALKDFVFGGYSNSETPTLTDEFDAVNSVSHANIQGNGHKIYNLNIDSTKYTVPNEGKTKTVVSKDENGNETTVTVALDGVFYATGENQVIDYAFTGLFGYANTSINNLHIVNPIVKGHEMTMKQTVVQNYIYLFGIRFPAGSTRISLYNNPATGALLGAGGYNTLITNCSTYVDKNAPGFVSGKMSHGDYSATVDQTWYGVSGEGAVGGLVGYAKSHRTVTGELTNNEKHLAFSRSFAAVNVSGNMRGDDDKAFGYSNGVGGFIGNSQLTNFYNCYASGDVKVNGCYVKEHTDNWSVKEIIIKLMGMEPQILYDGYTGQGAGGFVGTSHGTRYTNCFATGDVTASSNSRKLAKGAGGFVGFMSIDETFSYGNSASSDIAQRTVFTNCYSVGKAVANDNTVENFSGANGRIVYNGNQSDAYVTGDYFRLYAPHYVKQGGAPDFEDVYIYRDTYFLANYHVADSNAQDSSSNCANPEPYESFVNMVGKHSVDENGNPTQWIKDQIKDIKDIELRTETVTERVPKLDSAGNQVYDRWGRPVYENVTTVHKYTYDTDYFQPKAPTLERIYKELFAAGYSANDWEAATVNTTHAYDLDSATARYPFSKIKGLDYYGDWPSQPSALGMAYYESYDSATTDSNRYYHFDRKSTSTLLNLAGAVVDEDGYAILSAKGTDVTVTINGVEVDLEAETGRFQVGANNEYYIFLLTDALMNAAARECTGNTFFAQVSVTQGADSYTLWFNPNVAMSHLNPGYGQKHVPAPTADDIPKEMSIRSARQFRALSSMDNYWSEGYTYTQELNVDASVYEWSSTITQPANLNSIGSSNSPFQASYTVSKDLEQAQISGFTPTEAGFFGVIGADGSVENLAISVAGATVGNANTDDVAVFAGRNAGRIENVDLTINGDVTLTAKENAGLLAGYTSGTVADCEIAAGEVTMIAPNAGGFVGNAVGTANEKLKITDCTLTLDDVMSAEGTNVGGFAGVAEHIEANNLAIALKGMAVSADYAAGLAGYAENSSFTYANTAETTYSVQIEGNLINSKQTSAEEGTTPTGYMAGAIACAENTALTNINLNMESGEIKANMAAGFLGTGIGADITNCAVVIGGTLTGETKAAGAMLSVDAQSKIQNVPLTLSGATVTSTSGDAAGYAVEINGTVLNSAVVLGEYNVQKDNAGNVKSRIPDKATAISGAVQAAGYACRIGGTVDTGSVTGAGTISGESAAGFAVAVGERTQLPKCKVSPATTDDAYLGNANANLTVSGTKEAAGFALSVGSEATITSGYTLCKVSGANTYGFAGINDGSITASTANIDISGGFAFVGTNNGLVARCYSWYGNGNERDTVATDATLNEGTGKCFSAYFVDRDIPDLYGVLESALPSVVLYKADGKISDDVKSPSLLRSIGAEQLASEAYTWTTSAAQYEYPYSTALANEEYEYPMIRAHYGDWVVAPKFAYGVVYYETYDDGSLKIRVEDLSDPTKTIEKDTGSMDSGCVLWGKPASSADSAEIFEAAESRNSIIESTFDNSGTILKAGYALFCRTGEQTGTFEGVQVGEQIQDIPTEVLKSLYHSCYSFYALEGTEPVVLAAEDGNASVTVDLRFADAFNDTDGTFEVRTQNQLANIGLVSANFSQTHDILVESGKLVQLETFAENQTYSGNNNKLTLKDPQTGWITTVAGQVNNLNLVVEGNVTQPLFGEIGGLVTLKGLTVTGDLCAQNQSALITTVSNTFNCPAITVNGNIAANNTVFGTVSGTVGATTITVDKTKTISGSLINTVSGESASVTLGDFATKDLPGTLIGTVAGGQVHMGKIETGVVSGSVVGEVTGGSVETKAITTGNVIGKVFGDVAGEVKTSAITAGTVGTAEKAAQIFGNITSGSVTVTNGITLGNLNGNVFGEVSANVTAGGITTGVVAEGSAVVVKVSGGESSLGTIKTGAVTGKVFGDVGAKVDSGSITVDGTAKQIFGNVNSGEVKCGSIHVTGDADQIFGGITAKVETGDVTADGKAGQVFGNVTGGEIKTGAITVSGDTNQIFGSIGAKVNTGVITVSGKAGQIAGSVTGGNGVTIQKIDAQNVTTQIFGAIQAETKITDGITVRDLKGNVFGTVSANVTAGDIKLHSLGGKIATGVTDGEVKLGNIELTALAAVAVDEVAAIAETPTGEAGSAPTGTTPPTAPATPTVGTLFGSITAGGKVMGNEGQKTIQLGDAEISSSLFEKVSGGEIHGFKVITTGDMQVSLVGDKLAGNLVNLDLDCGSVTVTSSGILVSEMTSGLIEGCEVKAGNVVSTAPVFGGITGNVIDGEIKTSKVDVTSITVKAEEPPAEGNAVFGGIAAEVKSGVKLTDNIVSADMNVTGKAGRLTVVGGIVGINNAAISGGNANVEVTYTQNTVKNADNTETHDQVRIGGIVGWMQDGSLSGTTAAGEIKLASGSGSGRQNYFIGGAVAYDGGATYQGVSAAVKIDEKWTGCRLVTLTENNSYAWETAAESLAAISPAGTGPVGKFVGYVSTGSFANCSSVGSGTTANYEFLGEVAPATDKLKQVSIGRTTNTEEKYVFESDPTTEAQNNISVWMPAKYSDETLYAVDTAFRKFNADLDNCRFDLPNDSNTYVQTLDGANYYFYGVDAYDTLTNYATTTAASITFNGPTTVTYASFEKDPYKTATPQATEYYHLVGENYYRVYATYTYRNADLTGWENYYETCTLYYYDASNALTKIVSATNDWKNGWQSPSGGYGLYTMSNNLAENANYVAISADGTQILSVDATNGITAVAATRNADGAVIFLDDPADTKNGCRWIYVNQMLKFAKNTEKTVNVAFGSGNGSYPADALMLNCAVGDLGNFNLYAYSEVNHWYRQNFTLSDQYNAKCSKEVLKKSAVVSIAENDSTETTPTDGEAVSGETQDPNA